MLVKASVPVVPKSVRVSIQNKSLWKITQKTQCWMTNCCLQTCVSSTILFYFHSVNDEDDFDFISCFSGETFMLHFPIYKINISVLLVVQSAASTALQGSSAPSKCQGGLSPQSFCFRKLINNPPDFLWFCWHYRFRSFTVTFITVSESKLHKLWSCFPNLELNFCRTLLDLSYSHGSFPSSGGCAPVFSLCAAFLSEPRRRLKIEFENN